MTQEQKEQLAREGVTIATNTKRVTQEDLYRIILWALDARDEEFALLRAEIEDDNAVMRQLKAELAKAKNPWITDRDPEIRGSISDAVLLLIDGMFYKVSRLERRKDGSEFWWGVDVANGEEVTAWMPIPSVEGGDV